MDFLLIQLLNCNVLLFQKILEEITNADTGAPCSPQHLKKVCICHLIVILLTDGICDAICFILGYYIQFDQGEKYI